MEAVQILKGREGIEVNVRAREWLDMGEVKAALREDENLERGARGEGRGGTSRCSYVEI